MLLVFLKHRGGSKKLRCDKVAILWGESVGVEFDQLAPGPVGYVFVAVPSFTGVGLRCEC